MNRKAQVWVSTVLYTLIGLAVITLLLAVVRPKITEIKDSFIIDQTINSLNSLDKTILEVRQAAGNRRSYSIQLSRGDLGINPAEGTIKWTLTDSKYQYSEEDLEYKIGSITALTTKAREGWQIELWITYTNIDMTVNGAKEEKVLSPATTPYEFWIQNNGGIPPQIDITIK